VAAPPASEALGDAPDEVCEGFRGRCPEGHERDAHPLPASLPQ
jgi:hypothetical protein